MLLTKGVGEYVVRDALAGAHLEVERAGDGLVRVGVQRRGQHARV